ncbi:MULTISPECIES: hypothetical protein [unclassified Nocardia]|uniref:hypothetical protein n=1 Tax=unclassified Nocardia TaxID=2637762 RepID=UPI002E0E4629|nr:hypothetical protein OG326_23770 [Nocardia sp. NBC_01327]
MADAPLRTKSGAPSAMARKMYGMDDGSSPVFDPKSAEDAIRLRGNNQAQNPAQVLNHVAKQARKHGLGPDVLDKVAAARKEDRKR